jgi:hypothetical protein
MVHTSHIGIILTHFTIEQSPRGQAIKSGTNIDTLVGQVAYETGISTPEAPQKVRRIKDQLNNV